MFEAMVDERPPVKIKRILDDGTVIVDLGVADMQVGGMLRGRNRCGQLG